MAFGNVIPIDEVVAHQLARRQIRFRWLSAGLFAIWLAVLAPTLVLTPLPPIGPFMALAVLVVLAEHRFVLFGDETSMSASIIVIVASIFVFAETAPFAGPLLIASIGGLYLPHLRASAFGKIAFNGGGMGVAAWSASIAAAGFAGFERSPLGALSVIAGTLAVYWVINNMVVAGHQATLRGQRFTTSAAYLVASDTEVLVWAAAGCVGAVSANGASTAAIAFLYAVVACHAASPTMGRSRLRNTSVLASKQNGLLVWLGMLALSASRGTLSASIVALGLSVALALPTFDGATSRILSVGLPLVAVLALDSGPVPTWCALGASCLLLARQWSANTCWTACLATGALGSVVMIHANLPPFFHAWPVGMATAAVLPTLTAMALFAFRSHRIQKALGFWTTVGIAIPTPLAVAAGCFTIGTAAASEQIPVVALGVATAVVAIRTTPIATALRSSAGASR